MTTTYDVKILSTGGYLPGDPLDNATLEKYVGPLPDDVLDGIQVKTRYWMIDPVTGKHLINNSRMAERASRQALERAGVEPDEVDLIVVCTATPEYTLPNVATTLPRSRFAGPALAGCRRWTWPGGSWPTGRRAPLSLSAAMSPRRCWRRSSWARTRPACGCGTG
jgi:hypothetical protein